jgi:hypothetical protein
MPAPSFSAVATIQSMLSQCNHTISIAEIDWGVVIKKEQHVFLHPNTEITPWYQVGACP